MTNRPQFAAICASAALATVLSASAAQATTFATFSQVGSASNLTWLNPVTPAVTRLVPAVTKTIPAVTKVVNGKKVIVTPAQTIIVTPAHTVVVTAAHDGKTGTLFSTTTANSGVYGLAKVKFNFLLGKLSTLGPLDATFSLLGTAPAIDPAVKVSSFLLEPNLSGGFSFIYSGATPLHVWGTTYLTGANLLTATVGGLDIAGAKGGTSGGVTASTSGGDLVNFTSDFLDFTSTVDRDVAFNLTSISPVLGADPGAALHTFKASAGGAFSSTPAPHISAVPEPATWTMMILGFGALGLALRARRPALVTQ